MFGVSRLLTPSIGSAAVSVGVDTDTAVSWSLRPTPTLACVCSPHLCLPASCATPSLFTDPPSPRWLLTLMVLLFHLLVSRGARRRGSSASHSRSRGDISSTPFSCLGGNETRCLPTWLGRTQGTAPGSSSAQGCGGGWPSPRFYRGMSPFSQCSTRRRCSTFWC
jgi:hypothetical protein